MLRTAGSSPWRAAEAAPPASRASVAALAFAGLMAACAGGPASMRSGAQTVAAAAASHDACAPPSASIDYMAAAPVRQLRVYTDRRSGDSAIEDIALPPKRTPLLKTGKILYEYDFGKGSKVQIVAAPGDLALPLHPAPYRESFLLLAGSVTMELGDGTRRELRPGDMTTFEDTDARIGHGGRTGPCGYVALNIVP